ncbi:PIH1 domain-containing protein 1-like [Bacillus rossius redtenbacheri]|uniref:PIH1 domain-containing protein 1-like n=1 Tax=Bacillus rossius redtenbacheri TaxID=93214 RepID=UPI002FDD869D
MSGGKSVFLDVDSTILEKRLLMEDNDDDFDFLNPSSEKDVCPWKLVTPKPGLCVKTRNLSTGEKVFINVCTTGGIPDPEDISEAALVQILSSDDPTTFRVPMSINEPYEHPDKSGKPSTVYDVAISTNFFTKMNSSDIFRPFVIQVIMDGLQSKYDISLESEEYSVLKNRKAMGALRPHRVQQREVDSRAREPLIQEVYPPVRSPAPAPCREPRYSLVRSSRCLLADFRVDDVVSSRDLTLDVGEDRIILEGKKAGYLLDIFVPYCLDQDKTSARFNTDTKTLHVKMPIVSRSQQNT